MVKNNLSGFYKNIQTSSNRKILNALFDIRLFLNDKSSITQHIIQDNIINELEKILFIYNRPE